MNEEISFAIGADTTPFSRAMRGLKGIANEGAQSVKDEFVSGIKNIFAPLAAGFAAKELYESVKSIAEYGKQLKTTATEAGVSTEFIQGLEGASHKLGISAESASNALAIMSRKVGEARTGADDAQKSFDKWGISIEGLSNEQIFYQIADRMKDIPDPAQRAAMAFELMGKGAKEMVAALPLGADALKDIINNISKLSDPEIEKLHEIDARLEEIGRHWKVIWAGIVTTGMQTPAGILSESAISAKENELRDDWFKHPEKFSSSTHGSAGSFRDDAIKSLMDESGQRDRILQTTQKENELLDKADSIRHKTELHSLNTGRQLETLKGKQAKLEEEIGWRIVFNMEYGKQSVDLEDAKVEILATQAKLEAQKTAEMEKQSRYQNAWVRFGRAINSLEEAKKRPGQYTVDELANSEYKFGGQLGKDQDIAKRIAYWMGEAQRAHNTGDLGYQAKSLSIVDQLREQLSKAVVQEDRDPLREQKQAVVDAADALKNLITITTGKGININLPP